MTLTGKQIQEFRDALLDAYRSHDELRMMLRIELDEQLEAVAGGDNLRILIFNLIIWAERTGRVNKLLQGAARHNPGNDSLQRLLQTWYGSTVFRPAMSEATGVVGQPAPSGPVSIDVFLSYSRKDRDAMRIVYDSLREAGLSVWTDEGLEAGTPSWQDAIEEAVGQAQAMVVLLSPDANQSRWVKREVSFAETRHKTIFPVLIAGTDANAVPISLIDVQRLDGREDLRHLAAADLLSALRRHANFPAVEARIRQDAADREVEEKARLETADRTAKEELEQADIRAGPLSERERAPQEQESTADDHYQSTIMAQQWARQTWKPILTFTLIAVLGIAILAGVYGISRYNWSASSPDPSIVTAVETANAGVSTVETETAAARTVVPRVVVTRTNPIDGAVYVYVPAGPFIMGASDQDSLTIDDEKPQQPDLALDGFWIMQTEVTNAQYAKCVEEGVCSEPDNTQWSAPAYVEHPVTDVGWEQANTYAQWAGGRLPTEAEWEKTCRGIDGRIYPWGDEPPTPDLTNFYNNVGSATPVGRYPDGASPYGALDMAGNVWEWTSSLYRPYPYDASDGREAAESAGPRTLRGGAWYFNDQYVRCAVRSVINPGWSFNVGFRVVSPGS